MRISRPISFAIVLISLSAAAEDQPADQDLTAAAPDMAPAETAAVDVEPIDAEPAARITEDDFLREFTRFRQLLADKNLDEADITAKRIVGMAITLYGPQSHETAKALNNLAIVQYNNKQYESAIQNFTSAVEIIEVLEDRLNEQLVNPLKGLGAAQLGSGRPDQAVKSFRRATHITHVNEGPHNLEQIEILESLAEADVRLGDMDAAKNVLDRIHFLNVRHFKNNAMGLLPSLMRRADWQHRAGYFNDERATYRRTIRIIESSAGKTDARLVQPLINLGQSYYYYEPVPDGVRGNSGSTGETYLKRAVRIAENAADFPWLELAMARLALADYYVVTESHSRARKIFKEVWGSLSTDEDHLEMRKELLEQPVAIREEPLPRYTNSANVGAPGKGFLTGTVRVDYTVTTRGRVRDIRTEVNPEEFAAMQKMVHREIRRRIFRPALDRGEPVESGNQVFEHEFFYRQAELDGLRDKIATAKQESAGKK